SLTGVLGVAVGISRTTGSTAALPQEDVVEDGISRFCTHPLPIEESLSLGNAVIDYRTVTEVLGQVVPHRQSAGLRIAAILVIHHQVVEFGPSEYGFVHFLEILAAFAEV